jgi:phage-related tail protein
MKLIAIDPGSAGGFAWEDSDGIIQCCKMPETEGDVHDKLLEIIALIGTGGRVIIEEVGGYVGGGGQPGSAMFAFGRGFGFILGVLAAYGMKVELVRPQKWQKHFSLGTSKNHASKTAWKNHIKAKAQQLFPDQPVTLKTADALLLLDYGKHNQ